MENEKIISTILERVGNTDVSPQTVATLVSLKPVAEGSEPDEAYFDELAGAVRSVQGNVNSVFSAKLKEQVASKVEELRKGAESKKEVKPHDGELADGRDERLRKLEDELARLRDERQREKAERERKDLLASVRKGLEDKFAKSGSKVNAFFAKSALSKLSIPDGEADVRSLVDEAERLYNADVKEAGYTPDAPHAGGQGAGGQGKGDAHEWDDVARIVGRNRPKAEN